MSTTYRPPKPTHESMRKKGYVAIGRGVAPDGRTFTTYADPRDLPEPDRDYRVPAEQLKYPSLHLRRLHGGRLPQDEAFIPKRDMIEREEGELEPDGKNNVSQEEFRRAFIDDMVLRNISGRDDSITYDIGDESKTGFLGYQQIMRHVPYIPPTQRDGTPNDLPLTGTQASGVTVEQLPTRNPKQRAGMWNRPGFTQAMPGPALPLGESTRNPTERALHGEMGDAGLARTGVPVQTDERPEPQITERIERALLERDVVGEANVEGGSAEGVQGKFTRQTARRANEPSVMGMDAMPVQLPHTVGPAGKYVRQTARRANEPSVMGMDAMPVQLPEEAAGLPGSYNSRMPNRRLQHREKQLTVAQHMGSLITQGFEAVHRFIRSRRGAPDDSIVSGLAARSDGGTQGYAPPMASLRPYNTRKEVPGAINFEAQWGYDNGDQGAFYLQQESMRGISRKEERRGAPWVAMLPNANIF